MSYWDTSAIAKLFLDEADASRFRELEMQSDRITTSSLTRFEARVLFWRHESSRTITAGMAAKFTAALISQLEWTWIEVRMDVQELEEEFERVLDTCWRQATPLRIRSLDAIHLATALMANETQFVTADVRQRAAAELLGLDVI